jgi:hypothetical protein
MKVEPVTAAAVSFTEVLYSKLAEQVEPQLILPVELVIVPLPFPARTTVRVYVLIMNVAVTEVSAVMGTVQVPMPKQPPPLQPVNVEPVEAEAVRVTEVLKMAKQVEGQLMPPGSLVTMPLPEPADLTVSRYELCVKAAVTVVAPVIGTVQVPVPEQPPPLQPVKVEPAAAAAVRVTEVLKLAEQVKPQSMPAGELVTVPLPVPAGKTVRIYVLCMKVAVTVTAVVIGRVQVPVPGHPVTPLHPVKIEPAAAEAVRITEVLKLAEQVEPQLIPAGALVTVPLPVPAGTTVRR